MIHNPILHGFNPDPSILRVGDEYYIATSTFEWFPGIALYHSRNLKEWELIGHALTDERQLCLSRLSSAKGVWAPSLTYNHEQKQFYLAYSLMYSHNARYFDLDNFVVVAPAITGPWSDPVYLHSVGFDHPFSTMRMEKAMLSAFSGSFAVEKGRPDCIVIQEYDKTQKKLVENSGRCGGAVRSGVAWKVLISSAAESTIIYFVQREEPDMGMLLLWLVVLLHGGRMRVILKTRYSVPPRILMSRTTQSI
jgi:beta-xylosidase